MSSTDGNFEIAAVELLFDELYDDMMGKFGQHGCYVI